MAVDDVCPVESALEESELRVKLGLPLLSQINPLHTTSVSLPRDPRRQAGSEFFLLWPSGYQPAWLCVILAVCHEVSLWLAFPLQHLAKC